MTERISAPKWVCAAAIVVGVAAFIVQCAIDIYQLTQGVTDPVEWWTQAWQASLPTGLTIVISAFGGCLLFARAWVSAIALYTFVGLVMAITASNGIDFLSNSTVAKSVAAQKRAVVASDITNIQIETAKKERQDTLETLWRTYTVTKKLDEKERVLGQIKGVTAAPIQLQPPQIEEMKLGGGMILSRRFGWSPDVVQEVRSVALPILVLIGKSLAITLGFAFWPAPQVYDNRKPEKPMSSKGIARLFGKNVNQNVNQNVMVKSREEAFRDLHTLYPSRSNDLTISVLRRRWGVSKQAAYIWLKDWAKQGLITLKYSGNKLYVASIQDDAISNVVPIKSATA